MDFSRYGLSVPEMPLDVMAIMDTLRDLDDEHSLCGLTGLQKLGFTNLKCVVANLSPAQIRALATKGTLKTLGLSNVPVGVGTAVYEGKFYPYEASVPYLADSAEIESDGESLLVRTLENSKDNSIVLVLQSGLTDAANLLRNHEKLFVRKVKQVAIMGGVETHCNEVFGCLEANNANNNSFDPVSADWLYTRLQQVRVPMIITTREVAYAAQVPFSAYERLEATGNPIGKCLKERQLPALQNLFEQACSPEGSDRRETLPADRDRAWFVKVFCAGVDPEVEDCGNILPYLGCFNLYDPSSLYAAIPVLRARFLDPYEVIVSGMKHLVVGVSKERNGVKNPTEFANFMIDIEVFGLES